VPFVPNRTRRLLALPVLVLASGLAAAPACAGSDSSAEVARSGVIVPSDVPSTWTSTPADSSGDAEVDRVA
jgi:hypothetical protein